MRNNEIDAENEDSRIMQNTVGMKYSFDGSVTICR